MKLTRGCEIRGNSHRGDSAGCFGGAGGGVGAFRTVRVYTAIQLVTLIIFFSKSDAV